MFDESIVRLQHRQRWCCWSCLNCSSWLDGKIKFVLSAYYDNSQSDSSNM